MIKHADVLYDFALDAACAVIFQLRLVISDSLFPLLTMARRWTDITSDDEDAGVFLARLWPQPLQHAGPIAAPVPGTLQQRGQPPRRVRDAQRATGGAGMLFRV